MSLRRYITTKISGVVYSLSTTGFLIILYSLMNLDNISGYVLNYRDTVISLAWVIIPWAISLNFIYIDAIVSKIYRNIENTYGFCIVLLAIPLLLLYYYSLPVIFVLLDIFLGYFTGNSEISLNRIIEISPLIKYSVGMLLTVSVIAYLLNRVPD